MTVTVNVVWLVDVGGYGRGYYDRLLTRHRGLRVRVHDDQTLRLPPMPNAVVVCNRSVLYGRYLERYERAGIIFSVLHLSDEFLRDDRSFLHMACCRLVFRVHFDPKIASDPRVHTIPLGFRDGMNIQDAALPGGRPYDWCFAGDPNKSDRATMLRVVEKDWPAAHSFRHLYRGFGSSRALPCRAYGRALRASRFVLCPRGWKNLETFRLYEALEAGAVPVTLSHTRWQPHDSYWNLVFDVAPVPFIARPTWRQAIADARQLAADPVVYEQVRSACVRFWHRQKQASHRTVGHALKDVFAGAVSNP
jgi:hypothetical protein